MQIISIFDCFIEMIFALLGLLLLPSFAQIKSTLEKQQAKKILIVEDDNIQQIILERLLTKMGHTVIGSSAEGAKAIESALRIGAVDLIFMDIDLADDVDGIEAAKEISKHREVKLVYVTGHDDPELYNRAKETDYIAYLRKPISLEILEETFSKAFPSEN